MKYQVGDLILIKNIDFRLRPLPRLPLRLQNTYGIITAVEKDSTEKDKVMFGFHKLMEKNTISMKMKLMVMW